VHVILRGIFGKIVHSSSFCDDCGRLRDGQHSEASCSEVVCDLLQSSAFSSAGTSSDGNSVDGALFVFEQFSDQGLFIKLCIKFLERMGDSWDVGVDGVGKQSQSFCLMFLIVGEAAKTQGQRTKSDFVFVPRSKIR
jgi:hypothetical protein